MEGKPQRGSRWQTAGLSRLASCRTRPRRTHRRCHGGLSRTETRHISQGPADDAKLLRRHSARREDYRRRRRRHAGTRRTYANLLHRPDGTLAGGHRQLRQHRQGALLGRRLRKIRRSRLRRRLGVRGTQILLQHLRKIRRTGDTSARKGCETRHRHHLPATRTHPQREPRLLHRAIQDMGGLRGGDKRRARGLRFDTRRNQGGGSENGGHPARERRWESGGNRPVARRHG